MKINTFGVLLSFALTASLAAPALAADKETRQMMADIRILQEQSQQLQNTIAQMTTAMNEAIKGLSARLDEQTNTSRKSMADQKLIIDTMANDLRMLREKVDDNNVRVGSLGQEIDALRQSVSAINTPRPLSAEADSSTAGTTTPDSQIPAPTGAAGVGASPKKLLDGAMADYYAGQYDLAALGLDSYVKTFPQSTEAPEAQLRVGNSYLQLGKNDKAVDAYDATIRTYPKSNVIPEAYAKKGLALMNLKQYDKAREALEYCIKNYPADNPAVIFAQQRVKEIPAVPAPTKR